MDPSWERKKKQSEALFLKWIVIYIYTCQSSIFSCWYKMTTISNSICSIYYTSYIFKRFMFQLSILVFIMFFWPINTLVFGHCTESTCKTPRVSVMWKIAFGWILGSWWGEGTILILEKNQVGRICSHFDWYQNSFLKDDCCKNILLIGKMKWSVVGKVLVWDNNFNHDQNPYSTNHPYEHLTTCFHSVKPTPDTEVYCKMFI